MNIQLNEQNVLAIVFFVLLAALVIGLIVRWWMGSRSEFRRRNPK